MVLAITNEYVRQSDLTGEWQRAASAARRGDTIAQDGWRAGSKPVRLRSWWLATRATGNTARSTDAS